LNLKIPSPLTKINSHFLKNKGVELYIKRDDLIHEIISGNKWRKLKYNFLHAKKSKIKNIVSYGGKYSNHLHALSYMSKQFKIQSIGVVRGEREKNLNHTLSFCTENDMKLIFIDRSSYRTKKYDKKFLEKIKTKLGDFYLLPEGGNNKLGVKGCKEIISEIDIEFDYFCSSVGTGCTASGVIQKLPSNKKFIGFTPFKKNHEQISVIQNHYSNKKKNWYIFTDTEFGGFGKFNRELLEFINEFYLEHKIKLDHIYNGKQLFYLFILIKKNFFPKKTRIIALHTGGIQGLESLNKFI